MHLSSKDIEYFYSVLKKETFFFKTKKEIEKTYRNYIRSNALSKKNSFEKLESAILHAISMQYYDCMEFINACMPARIYIVVSIASFITEMRWSVKIVPDEIKRDLLDILTHGRIREYKNFFCHEDYSAMLQEEEKISEWVNE